MAAYFTSSGDAELREVSGEMNSIVATGKLIISPKGTSALFQVGSNTWEIVKGSPQGPYKKIDSRTFMFPTPDYMTTLYVSLAKGAPEAECVELARVVECIAQGQDPTPKPPPPAPAAAAAEPSAAAAAPAGPTNQLEQIGAFMGALGNAARQLGNEMAKKAAEDTKMMMDNLANAGKPAPAKP